MDVNLVWFYWRRAARRMIGALLVITTLSASGCIFFSQSRESHPSETISDFLKQPRPGDGLLGP